MQSFLAKQILKERTEAKNNTMCSPVLSNMHESSLHKGPTENFIMKYKTQPGGENASETSTSQSLGFADRFVGPETSSEDDWAPQGSARNLGEGGSHSP